MSEPLRFAYVCERDFLTLPGNDAVRHCDQCRLDVINYDLLDSEAREAVLRRASTERVCLFATTGAPVPLKPCKQPAHILPLPPPPSSMVTGGIPVVPERYGQLGAKRSWWRFWWK